MAILSALGAAFFWATGALLAYRPATHLGPFEHTRTQLIFCSALLCVIVTGLGSWAAVRWEFWPSYIVAAVAGVVIANLAMFACMKRGGPRRSQLLSSLSAPIAAVIAFFVLGESLTLIELFGGGLAFAGVMIAILFKKGTSAKFDTLDGSILVVLGFGLLSAACNAIGLIALKPALLAGTDPLAATAIRTTGGAFMIAFIALWPLQMYEPLNPRTPKIVVQAIIPGVMGYVLAVSLQLYAVSKMDVGIAALLGSTAPVMMLPLIAITAGERPPFLAWFGAIAAVLGIAIIFIY